MLAHLPPGPPPQVAVVRAPTLVSGAVLDAKTGRPIAGVYVQQVDGLAATFTSMDGSFRLTLGQDGSDRLSFSAPNYQPDQRPIGSGRGLRVLLRALDAYLPPSPPPGPPILERPILDTGIGFSYRLRQQQVLDQGGSVGALADNDFALSGRLRLERWLLQADGSHVQVPIDVAGLPADQNPAFTQSTYRAGSSLGYLTDVSGFELALGPSYRFENTKPYNHDVRYIGNRFDFEQTRHALGLEGSAGWRRGRWALTGALGAYPLVVARAIAPGAPFANQFGARASLGVSCELVSELHAGLAYRYEGWYGNGSDSSSLLAVEVFYAPAFGREARP